jgi:competence protein ComEA
MLKKLLPFLALLYAAASFAAVDVNKASVADLDGIKGIGPALSARILDARKKGEFKSWDDLLARVKGIGQGNAAKYSAGGLTVNGEPFKQ